MSDMKEALIMMRRMASERIRMLKDGVTLYDNERKEYYLKEYEAKVRELDTEIRRLSFKVVGRQQ